MFSAMSSGQGTTLRAPHVYMQADLLVGGRKPAFVRMVDFLVEMAALRVMVDQLETNLYRHSCRQFTDVADVGLGREIGGVPLFQIAFAEPQFFEDLVAGLVEQDHIIGHVEMAVVIDPVVLDGHRGTFDHLCRPGNGHNSSFCVAPRALDFHLRKLA